MAGLKTERGIKPRRIGMYPLVESEPSAKDYSQSG